MLEKPQASTGYFPLGRLLTVRISLPDAPPRVLLSALPIVLPSGAISVTISSSASGTPLEVHVIEMANTALGPLYDGAVRLSSWESDRLAGWAEQSPKPFAPTGIVPVQWTCAVLAAVFGTTRFEPVGVDPWAAGSARPRAIKDAPARAAGNRRMWEVTFDAGGMAQR